MGNLHRVVVSGATALNLLFVGLTTTPNPKYQRRKVDYHHLNHFTLLDYSLKWYIFKGLQEKLIISIRILFLYHSQ